MKSFSLEEKTDEGNKTKAKTVSKESKKTQLTLGTMKTHRGKKEKKPPTINAPLEK